METGYTFNENEYAGLLDDGFLPVEDEEYDGSRETI